jgi:general secretion pathway protein G
VHSIIADTFQSPSGEPVLHKFISRLIDRFLAPGVVLRMRQSGFTLLELLVVMVIIGLLAGYVGPKYFSQIGKSEIKATRAQIDALEKSLDQYRLDVGHYPNTEQGLAALMKRPAGENRWQGPYLKKDVPLDPWGAPYQYVQPGEHGEFDLFSFGKDGKAGGEDENADITNW